MSTGDFPHTRCASPDCPICNRGRHLEYRLPPQPQVYQITPSPMGCICPPTSEQTCQNPACPRKGFRLSEISTAR